MFMFSSEVFSKGIVKYQHPEHSLALTFWRGGMFLLKKDAKNENV